MQNIYSIIPSPQNCSLDQLQIYMLCLRAIEYTINKKTVCLASLGIRTEDKHIMKQVVESLRAMGFGVQEREATNYVYSGAKANNNGRPSSFWAGGLDYYEITSALRKIAYYITQQPPKGEYSIKRIHVLIDNEDGTFSNESLPNTLIEKSELNLPTLTECKCLAPDGSYLWINSEGEIYYSEDMEGIHLMKAEKY